MSRLHSSGVRVVCLAAILLVALLVFSALARCRAIQRHDGPGAEDSTLPNVPPFRRAPLTVAKASRPVLALSSKQREFVTGLMRPPAQGKASNSFCLHWLRIHGLRAQNPLAPAPFRTGGEVLHLLLDSRAGTGYFGTAPVVRTREGFRFLLQNETPFGGVSAESHRDHCLAALGELGVPSDSAVTVDGEKLLLEDALRDSVANFHLGQEEIEWTALAYALYLPPRNEWQNRFGESYTFDALATELLGRPLGQSSCAGAHRLYTVAVLAQVDREYALFSPTTRARVWGWLERCLAELIRTQASDGSWSWDWHKVLTAEIDPQFRWPQSPATSMHRLVVTGHVLECLLRFPSPLDVPDKVIRKAAEWLWDRVREVDPLSVTEQFCPYTHAICALRDVSSPAPQDAGDGR